MTNPPLIRMAEHLQRLKLFKIHERLESLLQDASTQELTYADFLDRLLAEEVAAKQEKHVTMRTAMARFPYRKTLESFDFGFQPTIDRKKIQELAAREKEADKASCLVSRTWTLQLKKSLPAKGYPTSIHELLDLIEN